MPPDPGYLVLVLLPSRERERLDGVDFSWDAQQLRNHIALAHPGVQQWSTNLLQLATSTFDFNDLLRDERSLEECGLRDGHEVRAGGRYIMCLHCPGVLRNSLGTVVLIGSV